MTDRHTNYWHDLAATTPRPTAPFINGEPYRAQTDAGFDTVNPATGETLARLPACTTDDVDTAVASARRAFVDGGWARCAPSERKTVMLAIAANLREHAEELAVLDSQDAGKCIGEALDDVAEAADLFQWFGEIQDKLEDTAVPAGPGVLATVCHEPMGVVAAIVAWNYPLHNAAVKIAPALAGGNSVVLKPSEETPLSALRLAALCHAAGLPAGVLNVVTGTGHEAGHALARHMDIDAIGFTGSTAVGKQLLADAGASNMKTVSLECGGKSPNLVFDDCKRPDDAVEATIAGIFTNAGQVCSAHSRLLLQRGIAETFLERLVEHSRGIVPGDPLAPDTRLGAIVNARQHGRILDHIDRARREASLILGGEARQVDGAGWFVLPTIFTDVAPDSRLFQDEVFGPVLAVSIFDTEAEAIALANNSIYGLSASAWTDDLSRAHRLTRAVSAGTVAINTVDAVSLQTPFGGTKQSGIGRDYGLAALHKYMHPKTRWIEFDASEVSP